MPQNIGKMGRGSFSRNGYDHLPVTENTQTVQNRYSVVIRNCIMNALKFEGYRWNTTTISMIDVTMIPA